MKIKMHLTYFVGSCFIFSNLLGQPQVKRVEYSTTNGSPKLIEFIPQDNNNMAITGIQPDGSIIKINSISSVQEILMNQLNPVNGVSYKHLKSNTDSYGIGHNKFQQYYKDVKVVGGIYHVHTKNDAVIFMNGDYKPIKNDISVEPTFSKTEALENAKKSVYEEGMVFGEIDDPELVLIDPFLTGQSLNLAYKFRITIITPTAEGYNVYIDANTGYLLFKDSFIFKCFDTVHAPNISNSPKESNTSQVVSSANGNFVTRYSGTVTGTTDSFNGMYRLRDYSRGQGIETYDAFKVAAYNASTNQVTYNQSFSNAVDYFDYDNNWQEYNNEKKDNAALDIHIGTQKTYDYFLNVHGRNSLDDNGMILKSYVNLFGNIINSVPMKNSASRDFAINAYWDGQRMTYFCGDGQKFGPLTSQDVISHELAHGLCQNTANLFYHGESGALNEALSDIWGATIENANYGNSKKTWQIGEDFDLQRNLGFRSMNNPKSMGQPSTYRGQNWIWGMMDYNGVHIHSGVINYWYYLLCMGGAGKNDFNVDYNVSPIGMAEAAQLVFNTEVNLLTEFSDFQDFRMLILQNALLRFGQNSPKYASVVESFKAVGVTETLLPQQSFYQTKCALNPSNGDGVFSGDGYIGDGVYTSKTCFTNKAAFCNNSVITAPTSFKVAFLPGRNTVIEVGGRIGLIAENNRGIVNNRDWKDSNISIIPNEKGRIELRICDSYKSTTTSATLTNNGLASNTALDFVPAITENTIPDLNVFPNPAINNVNFEYSLNKVANVSINVFDANGLKVKEVLNESNQMFGDYIIGYDASKLVPGVYVVKLKINEKTTSQKFIIRG